MRLCNYSSSYFHSLTTIPFSLSILPLTLFFSQSYLRSTGRSTLPTKYSFTKVFTSDPSSSSTDGSDPNSQSSFFKDTTLPMIKDLLDGRSGLVCTYGVTNSGKSYTVQGERGDGKEGILPRAIDTVFNSISGLESESEVSFFTYDTKEFQFC